jgi:uncharacterized protein (DUF362 family)/ferredoxin
MRANIDHPPASVGNGSRVHVLPCRSFRDVREAVYRSFEWYGSLLPQDLSARILIKPNLNSHMNALTGNTTDLRILSALIAALKDRGFHNLILGEGTNSGFYRSRISVISRLKVDALAAYYGVTVKDLNYSEGLEITFAGGVRALIARECLEADLFINVPKLKTHFEVGMSVCLKNLIGCLVGQENKKKTHQTLAENILRLNHYIKPHLHVVDGLIAMEGLGPTRGRPKHMGLIAVGTDPFLLDMACARIAAFDHRQISTLKLAEERGIITADHHRFLRSLDLSPFIHPFDKPRANRFAAFIHNPRRQKYFLGVRNTGLFSYLASTRFVGHLLFLSGLRQDNFIAHEMRCEGLAFDPSRCIPNCTRCSDYCPMGLELPEQIGDAKAGCIHCLYCFLVCPTKAVHFKGHLGFMADQLRQYDALVREVA